MLLIDYAFWKTDIIPLVGSKGRDLQTDQDIYVFC